MAPTVGVGGKKALFQLHWSQSLGLLQPLPIPSQASMDISLDFMEDLPPSKGITVILVVVNRYIKHHHFFALSHPFTTQNVAQIFLDGVFRVHGLAKPIVSDRDPTFLSTFWQCLFSLGI